MKDFEEFEKKRKMKDFEEIEKIINMTCLLNLPNELLVMIATFLGVVDIVSLSMVNKRLTEVMRQNPINKKDKTPIYTDQDGVREVWKHIPFIIEYPHKSELNSVFVSGEYLYTGCKDGKARKIDINTGETLMEYPHRDSVMSVFVSGDYMHTRCWDKKARKIDINTGKTLMEYPHKDFVLSLFVSGEYLYTGCKDGKARKIPL